MYSGIQLSELAMDEVEEFKADMQIKKQKLTNASDYNFTIIEPILYFCLETMTCFVGITSSSNNQLNRNPSQTFSVASV